MIFFQCITSDNYELSNFAKLAKIISATITKTTTDTSLKIIKSIADRTTVWNFGGNAFNPRRFVASLFLGFS